MTKMWRLISVAAFAAVLVAGSPAQLGKGRGGGGGGKSSDPPPTRSGGNGGGSGGQKSDPPPTRGGGQRSDPPPIDRSRDRDRDRGQTGGGTLGGTRQDSPPTKGNGGGSAGDLGRGRDRDRSNQGGTTNGGSTRGGGQTGGTQTGGWKPPVRDNGGSSSQIGRIGGPITRGERIKDQIPTRTGSGNYGSGNNNQWGNAHGQSGGGRPPMSMPNLNKGSLAQQSARFNEARPVNNGWRHGYYQYNSDWCDQNFRYGFYVFNAGYNSGRCSVSPWYYYFNMPPYISYTRIVFIDNFSGCRWGYGDPYQYRSISYGYDSSRYESSDVDYAVEDIRNMWLDGDRRAVSRLISDRGRVNIYHDGNYSYSLSGDDFYDMLIDAVYDTDTSSYEILSVRRKGDEMCLNARHTFYNAWGGRESVYHSYRLVRERGGYVISDFSTGYRQLW